MGVPNLTVTGIKVSKEHNDVDESFRTLKLSSTPVINLQMWQVVPLFTAKISVNNSIKKFVPASQDKLTIVLGN